MGQASDASKKDLEASLVSERGKARQMEARLSDLQDRLNKAESAGGGRVTLGAKPLPLPQAPDGHDAQLRESLRAAQDKLKKTGWLRCARSAVCLPPAASKSLRPDMTSCH